MSSSASGRTAVFEVDISSLWDTMDSTGFEEILSAGFLIQPASYKNLEGKDSVLSIRHYLSDNLVNDGLILDSLLGKRGINVDTTLDSSGNIVDTVTLPVEKFLQNLITTRPSTVYFYIELSQVTDMRWEEVVWNKPRFRAVITTLK